MVGVAELSLLHLGRMIARQKGSPLRRFFHASFSVALRLFFRRIETAGEEVVPRTGPVLFVMNHPNGLIDPALVFCALPRRISFLAKSTLFGLPGFGLLLRTVEALPLYRQVDNADRSLNQRTFTVCFERLRQGGCIALFPEGISHSAPQMLPLKTGAARIALGAISLRDEAGRLRELPVPLRVQPVGLYYTSLTKMRGEVLLRFGTPFAVAPVELGADGQPPHDAVQELTERIATALHAVTLNVASRDELAEITMAEDLFSSLYETIDIRESLTESFRRLRNLAAGLKHYGAEQPDAVADLRTRVREYERELSTLGLKPQMLAVSQHSRWYVLWHVVARFLWLTAWLPLAVLGFVIHFPAHWLGQFLARRYYRHDADESVSTVQMLSAMMFMPLTWLLVAGVVAWRWGWRLGLAALPMTILAGYVALKVAEGLADLRGWIKAAWLLLRQRALFLRLLLERKTLHQDLARMGYDLGEETLGVSDAPTRSQDK